jgi:DDE superfamily endonuclease
MRLRRNFNKYLSSGRVNVEHTIGLLKLRFPILRRIGMVIGTRQQNARAVKLMRAACCLHNFLLDRNDPWELDAEERATLHREMDHAYRRFDDSEWGRMHDDDEGIRMANEEGYQRNAGESKRRFLCDQLMAFSGVGGREPRWWLQEI